MIDFGNDNLLRMAAKSLTARHFDEVLAILRNVPNSPQAAQLQYRASYGKGKELSALGNFTEAAEAFKLCTGSTVETQLRSLANERSRLLNQIFTGKVTPITQLLGLYENAKVKSVSSLHSEELAPTIWYVGCAAAYKSAYDNQWHDNLSRLVRRIKHAAEPETLRRLGELMAEFIYTHTPVLARADLLIPVPTSQDRWDKRGYQIPHTLGQVVSETCGIPMHDGVVQADGLLPDLRNIPRWLRSRVIQGAYKPNKLDWVRGLSLVILDDVINTGSTVIEIAKTLLDAGASEVAAIALTYNERT